MMRWFMRQDVLPGLPLWVVSCAALIGMLVAGAVMLCGPCHQ